MSKIPKIIAPIRYIATTLSIGVIAVLAVACGSSSNAINNPYAMTWVNDPKQWNNEVNYNDPVLPYKFILYIGTEACPFCVKYKDIDESRWANINNKNDVANAVAKYGHGWGPINQFAANSSAKVDMFLITGYNLEDNNGLSHDALEKTKWKWIIDLKDTLKDNYKFYWDAGNNKWAQGDNPDSSFSNTSWPLTVLVTQGATATDFGSSWWTAGAFEQEKLQQLISNPPISIHKQNIEQPINHYNLFQNIIISLGNRF